MVIPDSIPVKNSPETADENDESLIKENLTSAATPRTMDNGLTHMKSRWSFSSSKRSFGNSKDETFFDSHQWLQSDSEDDFHSVNGDFTPSLGNTPKCSFSEKLPRFHNPLFEEEEKPRVSFLHSLAPRRKKLLVLFRDSIREEREENLEEPSENQSEKTKKSTSDNSAELKIIEAHNIKEKKNLKSMNYHDHHHCLPRFMSFRGGSTEKRKRMCNEI